MKEPEKSVVDVSGPERWSLISNGAPAGVVAVEALEKKLMLNSPVLDLAAGRSGGCSRPWKGLRPSELEPATAPALWP